MTIDEELRSLTYDLSVLLIALELQTDPVSDEQAAELSRLCRRRAELRRMMKKGEGDGRRST